MADSTRPDGDGEERRRGSGGSLRCDFCGQEVERVRRIALDRGYERLQTPHQVRYACEGCSEEKERERRRASSA